MTNKVLVGTSGFGIGQAKYFETFPCVEVQHTFYQPPKLATLDRWRADAPPDFEFVLKAWQLITHDSKSPTYRRLKRQLSPTEAADAGYFRPTAVVKEAWEVTLASARALNARTILFQCPASFAQTNENVANLEKFFKSLSHSAKDLNLAWEPRGEWDSKLVKQICDGLGLWHAVDPFVTKTITPRKLYFRLHGKTGWRYEYEAGELQELAAMLPKSTRGYVFFNNVRMIQDALTFRTLLKCDADV
jgi:uncharacterized protein YecE (DUF72 family)